ncbi:GNAT family N-acetyltransferase [Terribacillus saccharophilus]|uniref:GNAT family N-acetyltransferase n=2 Tax=Terribacillus saccharophilus TaxID=361277 RepID=A0A268AC03_9BACI|nr:GNAT family N-acetyltransferase [Terribacillus saccharophilus]PAD21656.1 GNAT family N-acetyltransferase [Terribacillus saccharophilus]PAF21653.1 GNAT family N-acetyltransferase [Terribacillus saccharophilus]
MLIREIRIDDGENFINLVKEVERKSDFMLMEAGERKTTPEQQQKQLERFEQQNNSTIFVAEEKGKLVGYLIAIGGTVKRTKHCAYLVIGILQEYRGKGIGSKLFDKVIKWAPKHNVSRLELTVVTENKAGLALYKKSGFDIEGTKRNSININGTNFDEYCMSKLL